MFNTAAFLLYIAITAITPGPNNILSMTNAARVGLRRALRFNLGIVCGLGLMMILCALFSAALFALAPKISLPMRILGAAYMLYLALKIYRSSAPDLEQEGGEAANQPEGETFMSGLLLQFVNVKIIIYGITAMSSYILPYFNAPPVVAAFAAGLTLACFCANMSWALFGSLFYRLFTKRQKLINTIMALLLVYCAVSLFL